MNFKFVAVLSLLVASVSFSACSGCSGKAYDKDAAVSAAIEQGHFDAQQVCQTPENSMQRERAILQIRSKESQLRNSCYDDCADAYIDAAEKTLADSLIITLQ